MSASEISRHRIFAARWSTSKLRGMAVRVRPSISRTFTGHLAVSVPWVWNMATARRSMPKATQPVWAGSPLASCDAPGRAEMVAVIVEAHAGGRLFFRAQRHQQFELQRLLFLAHRLHLADPAEEGVARIVDA